MTNLFPVRVQEVTLAGWSGLGNVTLAGVPGGVTGRRTFASQFTDNDWVRYHVSDGAGNWELTWGQFISGANDELTRGSIVDSSDYVGGVPQRVNFPSGTHDVYIDQVAGGFDCGGRLVLDGGNLVLYPHANNQATVAGRPVTIPDTGIVLGPAGQPIDTTQYVYLAFSGANLVLEASTTGWARDKVTGIPTMSADATKTLVGMARAITGPAWADTPTQRFVASWWNRRDRAAEQSAGTQTTTSANVVELSASARAEFVAWGDEATRLAFECSVGHGLANGVTEMYVGLDGVGSLGNLTSCRLEFSNNNMRVPSTSRLLGQVAEGYHFATAAGRTISGDSAVFENIVVRAELRG